MKYILHVYVRVHYRSIGVCEYICMYVRTNRKKLEVSLGRVTIRIGGSQSFSGRPPRI